MIPTFDKAFEKVAEIRCRKKQHDAVKTYDISFYQIAFEFDRIIFSATNKYPPLDKIFGEDAVCLIENQTLFSSLFNFFLI